MNKKEKNLDAIMHIKVFKEDKEEYQKLADKKKVNLSDYVREVLNDHTKANRRRVRKSIRYMVATQEKLNEFRRYLDSAEMDDDTKLKIEGFFDDIVEGEKGLWGI